MWWEDSPHVDSPHVDSPHVDFPHVDFPHVDSPHGQDLLVDQYISIDFAQSNFCSKYIGSVVYILELQAAF